MAAAVAAAVAVAVVVVVVVVLAVVVAVAAVVGGTGTKKICWLLLLRRSSGVFCQYDLLH